MSPGPCVTAIASTSSSSAPACSSASRTTGTVSSRCRAGRNLGDDAAVAGVELRL